MPGGVCRDLGEGALRELRRRWPSVDAGAINSAAKNYQNRLQHEAETPASIRETMDDLVKTASALRLKLESLSEEADNLLWDDFQAIRQTELYEALPGLLSRLQTAAMRGHNSEVGRDGRRRLKPRHQLVAAIAWQLQQSELPVDKRPTGHLYRITEIVLQDLGESPAQLISTVSDAFDRINGADHGTGGQSSP